jgi:hypothetical protein
MHLIRTRDNEIIKMRFDEGATLQEIGEKFRISRERVRQIIHRDTAGRGGDIYRGLKRKRQEVQEARELEWKAMEAMAVAIANNMRCKVCGGWNIRGGGYYADHGKQHYTTCSQECASLFLKTRHVIDRDEFRRVQARSVLHHRQYRSEIAIAHAERVLEGANEDDPSKWVTHVGTGNHYAIVRIRNLRTTLGTVEDFDDGLFDVRIIGSVPESNTSDSP